MKFVLGSASPRRVELLAQIDYQPHSIIPTNIDESPWKNERPRNYVLRMAREKALAIESDLPILTADTSVVCGQKILGKPTNDDDARKMLSMISGRRHRVYSAIALLYQDQLKTALSETKIKFKCLTSDEIESYIRSGEWKDKAGGYAIQGRAAAFVTWISGSYSGVVGLPLRETDNLLKGIKNATSL